MNRFGYLSIIFFIASALHAAERQWYVDPTNGKEGAHGTLALPFASITEALQRIKDEPGDVTIMLSAGTYREESLVIPQRNGRTTLQGIEHQTIISGANIWTDWEERDGLWVAQWPHEFGLNQMGGYPEGELKHMEERGRRAEMVFVNDSLLLQVTDPQSLLPGTYFVNEQTDELFLNLPQGVAFKDAQIEVSTRGNLLQALRTKGLTLRNIVFTRAASGGNQKGLQHYSVIIAGEHAEGEVNTKPNRDFARDIRIENCKFEWNSSSGLTLANIIGLEVHNSSFDFNGISGIGANRIKNASYMSCSFNNNNWRLGLWGGVYGWAPAGTKQLFIGDSVFKNCTFQNNYATGLWLDFGNENVRVEHCLMADNADNGLYIEASAGPVVVKNTRIVRNGYQPQTFPHSGGLLIAESCKITVEQSFIADNLHYQIGVRSRSRPSSGYWSGTTFDGHCLDLKLHRSTLIGGLVYRDSNVPNWYQQVHGTASVIGRQIHSEEDSYQRWLQTYRGDKNTFAHRTNTNAFSTGLKLGFERIDLNEWKNLTKQDKRSRWVKAKWTTPRIYAAETDVVPEVPSGRPVSLAKSVQMSLPNSYRLHSLEIRCSSPKPGDVWSVQENLPRSISIQVLPAGMGIKISSKSRKADWKNAIQAIRFTPGPSQGERRFNVLMSGELGEKWLGGSLVSGHGKPLVFNTLQVDSLLVE